MNEKYNIGQYIFDKQQSSLTFEHSSVKLEPLPLAFLLFLIEHQGETITKEQLLANVWQNRQVTDDSIRRVVKKLRDGFNDDARQPSYIKTVSMQGYQLIAKVSPISSEPDLAPTQTRHDTWSTPQMKKMGLVITLIGLFILGYFFINGMSTQPAHPLKAALANQPSIKQLTHLSGSELGADYNPHNNLLLFSHRDNNDEDWQLYSKNLTTQVVKRLIWDDASYTRAMFSPEGKQVFLLRSDKLGSRTWLAQFDDEIGLSGLRALTKTTEFPDQYPLSWSSDAKRLYFSVHNGSTNSIFSLEIATQQWQQITFSNAQIQGDYSAKESPDGHSLAVLSNVSDRRYSLKIIDLKTKSLVTEKSLPFYASNILWQAGAQGLGVQGLMLSSFKGDLYHYQIEHDLLTQQRGSRPGLNDIFYACGENCVYMRSHDMNYSDLYEMPNPFVPQSTMSTLRIESTDADFHPIYNHQGDSIYYTRKGQNKASILLQNSQGLTQELFSFNPRHILVDLSLSPDETHLLGKLENRVFILNLQTKQMKFITSALEDVYFPNWQNSQMIYFTRQQQNNQILFSYDITTDKLERAEQGYIIRRQLIDGRLFVVDKQNNLFEQVSETSFKFIVQLPAPGLENWHIHQHFLYYSQHKNQNVVITRQDLVSGAEQTHRLDRNIQLAFSIHPSGKKLLLTQFLLANSDLVEVHWPKP